MPPNSVAQPEKPASRLRKSDWINAARDVLVQNGVGAVKVQPLATRMDTTTGSFYWHFKDRGELLSALLEDWEQRNTGAFLTAYRAAPPNPEEQLNAVARVWLAEDDFDPAYDAAIRDWARVSPDVEDRVRRVDDQRIDLLKAIFCDFGLDETRAFIRARITYFHQVGYYALRIAETREQREQLFLLYTEALIAGTPMAMAGKSKSPAKDGETCPGSRVE